MPGEWLQFKSIQLSSDDKLSTDFETENLQLGRIVETLDLSISSFWDRAYRRVNLSHKHNPQMPIKTRKKLTKTHFTNRKSTKNPHKTHKN